MNIHRNAGFTIIELLVVVTVIVVLISLLLPGLDRAIYQAELAKCGATIKAGVSAGLQYAFENKRFYPTRGTSGSHIPDWVKVLGDYDLVRDLKPYAGVAVFYDPFTKLDFSEAVNHVDTSLLAGQAWYFDWARANSDWDGIQKIMRKVGGRIVYDPIEDRGNVRSFSVLVSDLDIRAQGNGGVILGHPDSDSKVPEEKLINTNYAVRSLQALGKVTLHWYIGGHNEVPNRGTVDNNYGYDDGSVLRLSDVTIDDERVTHLLASKDIPNRQQQLPNEHRQQLLYYYS